MVKTKPLYDVRHVDTFREIVDSCAVLFPNEPAFKLKNRETKEYYEVNYTQFKEDVDSLGTALCSMGLRGSKIGVMGHNCYEWACTYLAVTCGVGVIVPIDKELQFDDIKTILEISETKVIICDDAAYEKLHERKDELASDTKYILMHEKEDSEKGLSYLKILESGRQQVKDITEEYQTYVNTKVDPDVMSVLIFTSGTTGLAKGVMLSQRNICFVVMSNSSLADIHPGDRMLSVLPLHHTYECSLGFLATIYNGCCISYCEGLVHLMKNMQEVQPTVFFTVPLMMEKIHARIMRAVGEKRGGRFILAMGKVMASASNAVGINATDKIFEEILKNFGGHLRLVIMGAAAIRSDVVADFKTFGIPLYLGYGLTECAPLVSCNHDALFTVDTVGNPIPGVEVKIINADSQGVGEVLIKGPNVMLGYYKDENETKEAIDEEGWFHSGDLGTYDEEKNLLALTGRIKNVIVTKNGKNIYPEEIEFHLNSNPLIAESLVVGSIIDEEGDTDDILVEAKIFPDVNAIQEKFKLQNATIEDISKAINDVIKEINKKLPSYKNIKKIAIRDSEFIKTTTSKIKRYAYIDENKKECDKNTNNPLKSAIEESKAEALK